MRQTSPLRNPFALVPGLVLLASCAATGEKVASEPAMTAAPALRSTGYAAPEMEGGAFYRSVAYAQPARQAEDRPSEPMPEPWQRSARGPLPNLDEIVIKREAATPTPVRYAEAQTFTGQTRSVMDDVVRPEEPEPAARPVRPAQTDAAAMALHLASYRATSQAEEGWKILSGSYPDVLTGLSPLTMRIDVPGQGEYVRLLAGPIDSGSAQTACDRLEDQGTYCAVIPMQGTAMDRL